LKGDSLNIKSYPLDDIDLNDELSIAAEPEK
jgi:hypothetical protein